MRTLLSLVPNTLILVSLVASPAGAVNLRDFRPGCGTSALMRERARLLHAMKPASRISAAADSSRFSLDQGSFIVRAGGANLSGDHPLDLVNTSVTLTRTGSNYTVAQTTLRYDADRGPVLRKFEQGGNDWYVAYALQKFTFPFGGEEHQSLYISVFNGITFTPPELSFAEQIDTLELAMQKEPVISPLLLTASTPYEVPLPEVYLKEMEDRVVITWRSAPRVADRFAYDLQAVLFRNGDVTFSYPGVKNLTWGTAVVTPGRAWQVPAELVSRTDPAGDVPASIPLALAPQMDLVRASLSRISDSDLLEMRIKTTAVPSAETIPPDDVLLFVVAIVNLTDPDNFDQIGVALFNDGSRIVFQPDRVTFESSAFRIEGDELVLNFLQSTLTMISPDAQIYVLSGLGSEEDASDLMNFRVTLPPPVNVLAMDFTSREPHAPRPFAFEAFTLPALDLESLWKDLKAAYQIPDDRVDAIAVYQTFLTDIVFYASAYAQGGNPQANGVRDEFGYGASYPRSPTLLHLNEVTFGWNEDDQGSGHILLHEFGHRWLYGIQIKEGTEFTHALNPVSEHPAEFVHTPAAFPVYSVEDASVMGGGFFTDNGNGTFSSAPRLTNFGYSWVDLYLMGLATPQEVTPWFYIANSNPPLGPAYYPPPAITVTGTRRDVTIQQVIDAMGARTPLYGESQRTFRVYFVLLTRGEAPTAQQLAAFREHQRILEQRFATATGSRGGVITEYALPARRRSARR